VANLKKYTYICQGR